MLNPLPNAMRLPVFQLLVNDSCIDSMVLEIVELYMKKVISQIYVGDTDIGEGQGLFKYSVTGQRWTS